MEQIFLVRVDVADGTPAADVAESIEKVIESVDGEQHLDLMNFEPIPMLNPKVSPVVQIKVTEPKNFADPTKYHGVLMEETRTKLFVRTHEDMEDPKDIEDDWWKFQTELEEKARSGELHSHFDDAPGFHYQYTGGYIDKDGTIQDTFDWKDFPNDSTREVEIPIEEI